MASRTAASIARAQPHRLARRGAFQLDPAWVAAELAHLAPLLPDPPSARQAGARVETWEYAAAGHAFYDRTDASSFRLQAAATARTRYLKFLRDSLA